MPNITLRSCWVSQAQPNLPDQNQPAARFEKQRAAFVGWAERSDAQHHAPIALVFAGIAADFFAHVRSAPSFGVAWFTVG